MSEFSEAEKKELLATAHDLRNVADESLTILAAENERLRTRLAEVEKAKDDAVEAAVACLLAQPMSNGQYVHLPTCSGDRREPAGKPGHSCSCAIAPKSLLTAAEQRGRAADAAARETMEEIEYWHADYLADTDSQNGWRRCYDKLRATLTPGALSAPPPGDQPAAVPWGEWEPHEHGDSACRPWYPPGWCQQHAARMMDGPPPA